MNIKLRGENLKSEKKVSVVLAGYNESDVAERSMSLIYKSLEDNFEDFELILVDDASKDNTLELMNNFQKSHKKVLVLKNNVNLNFGTAVLRGLIEASGDYVIYQPFDLALYLDDMVKILTDIEEDVDVLVLERQGYNPTKWRKLTSNVNGILLRILYPKLTKGTPILNYIQVYKREIVPKIIPLARSPIFVWPELIFRAKLLKLNVKNLPTKCNMDLSKKGSFGHPHDIIWGIYDMLRFRIRVWNKNY